MTSKDFADFAKELWKTAYERGKREQKEKIGKEIKQMQTYKMFVGDSELYLSRDDVLGIVEDGENKDK